MSKSMRTAEGFTLHMQWIEQFVREAEQALEQENVKATAQTVLFYAGMHVQIEQQAVVQVDERDAVHLDVLAHTEGNGDWLLAPEEEVVKAALQITPKPFHRLLQLSLQMATEDAASWRLLSPEECAYIHTYAGLYMSEIKQKVNRFGTYWLH